MESEKGQERSLQKLKETKRDERFRQVHDIRKYFDKISVVYSVCCIGFDSFVCGFRFWANFFSGFAGLDNFSSVLRLLMHPNVPLITWSVIIENIHKTTTQKQAVTEKKQAYNDCHHFNGSLLMSLNENLMIKPQLFN